ncbi:RpbA RNA polymerase binding protein, function unknown [Yersinia phage phiR1-RT]|uniref:RNA polymerase binding protein n=1 Tax=Yersinia phage phiR1-RT TaxID=1206558 RepID=I7LH47_BPPR1|nr:RNA polymerase binding [Yersinia phage phiR1-RT]CCI88634.1 RpbA RNA polymerase binding protein, function unknown [Yersinia phage phiR1-RT]
MIAITTKDLQPVNVRSSMNPNIDNRIRKSWVMQLPTELATQLRRINQETRFMIYSAIDSMVGEEWTSVMNSYKEDSIKIGASLVVDKIGDKRLEDKFCVDSDEHLITAALRTIDVLPGFFAELPLSVRNEMNGVVNA